MSQGKCIIFSAPSGAGKTTIVHRLLGLELGLEFSISACSRDRRGEEVDGKDYYFLGVDGFKSKIKEGAFVEWEEVYPNQFYGTLKSELERIWQKGNHVIFDVDVKGGLNLKQHLGDGALSIFIWPPSEAALRERLTSRATESEEKIQMRLSKAATEMKDAQFFDKVVVNDNLEHAVTEAAQAVRKFLANG